MSKRRKAREMALQMLYQSDVGGATWKQVLHHFSVAEYSLTDPDPISREADEVAGRTHTSGDESETVEVLVTKEVPRDPASRMRPLSGRRLDEAKAYAAKLAAGVLEQREALDEVIRSRAENWRIERMPVVDRNILRLAAYELQFEQDVPGLVVVDEAIELGKRFGSEKSGQFINGVLDGLLSLQQSGGFKAARPVAPVEVSPTEASSDQDPPD